MSEGGGRQGVISVRTEVVQEVLIPSLVEAAFEREAAPLPDAVEAALAAAPELMGAAPELMGAAAAPDRDHRSLAALAVRVARLGYAAREVELERFAPAREPTPWLAEALASSEPSGVSAELAAREPLEKPRPDDQGAATWRVPGPGGHVRHLVAMRAAARALEEAGGAEQLPDGATSARRLKRLWVYGFLVRCCEEQRA